MLSPVVLILCSFFLGRVQASPPVIYGEDNRKEIFEASDFHRSLAASVATMISREKISRNPERPGVVQVNQATFRSWLEAQFEESPTVERISFCPGERFIEQPNAGDCTGFLVGPDLLVTAGHCVSLPNFCENFQWVFGYEVDPVTGRAGLDLPESNVYSCKRVLSSMDAPGIGIDYGLIQLDRRALDRGALLPRTSGNVTKDTELLVIGSPAGLPLKIAGGATVRSQSHSFFFVSNLDAFQGNSGSPVINARTGEVEGILVRGEEDFEANLELQCIQSKRCEENLCRGEDVSRMSSVPELALRPLLLKLIEDGPLSELDKLLRSKFWVDIYGADAKTPLMRALELGKLDVARDLLKKGADPGALDLEGNTPLHYLAPKLKSRGLRETQSLLVSLEAKNLQGETPILVSARTLNLLGVKALMNRGGDIRATNNQNESVLFPFARQKDLRAIRYLVKWGADPGVRNVDGLNIDDLLRVQND